MRWVLCPPLQVFHTVHQWYYLSLTGTCTHVDGWIEKGVGPLLKQLLFPLQCDTDPVWILTLSASRFQFPLPTYAAKFDSPPVPHIEWDRLSFRGRLRETMKRGREKISEATREAERKLETGRELNSWKEESDKRNRHGSVSCPVRFSRKQGEKKRSQRIGHVTCVNCSLTVTVISSLSFYSCRSPFLSSVFFFSFSGPHVCPSVRSARLACYQLAESCYISPSWLHRRDTHPHKHTHTRAVVGWDPERVSCRCRESREGENTSPHLKLLHR